MGRSRLLMGVGREGGGNVFPRRLPGARHGRGGVKAGVDEEELAALPGGQREQPGELLAVHGGAPAHGSGRQAGKNTRAGVDSAKLT